LQLPLYQRAALVERLDTLLATFYLVFNEGHFASFGDQIVRTDLCAEAIHLGRLLVDLLPLELEPRGLLVLMLLHDARRATRRALASMPLARHASGERMTPAARVVVALQRRATRRCDFLD
jgi:predicted RNA polymerase sigma factor